MKTFPLLEEAREFCNHFVSNEIVYGAERCDPGFKNTVTSRDWFSDYKLKRGWLEVNFVPMGQGKAKLYTVVQMFPRIVRERTYVTMNDLATQFGRVEGKRPMFINRADSIQYPKRVRLERIPSLVRLQRFNDTDRRRKNILNRIPKSLIGVIADRKRGVPAGAALMKSCESPSQLIEARSKAIGELADHKRNFNRDTLALQANNMSKFFRIILARDGVRFWVKDLAKEGIDFIEVMFRPDGFELQIG